MKNTGRLFLSLVLFASCTKEVKLDLPVKDPKLVLDCFISPQDTLIRAWVSESVPVFGVNQNQSTGGFIPNATVVISDGVNSQTLFFDSQYQYYKVSASVFPIVGGRTYYMTVSTPDGKSCSAQTTVPATANTSLTATVANYSYSVAGNGFERKCNINYSFTDTPGEGDYYRVHLEEAQYYPLVPQYDSLYNDLYVMAFETDEKKDGTSFTYTATYDEVVNDTVNFNYSKTKTVHLNLLHVNHDYYDYHYRLLNYSPQNPFSEPTIFHSNVNNGYGCFGAYNMCTHYIVF
ncbi:MAG TPA: DUF4249 domain-containing protein [Bacteroidia bacterium]|jgi:hypothetical protein